MLNLVFRLKPTSFVIKIRLTLNKKKLLKISNKASRHSSEFTESFSFSRVLHFTQCDCRFLWQDSCMVCHIIRDIPYSLLFLLKRDDLLHETSKIGLDCAESDGSQAQSRAQIFTARSRRPTCHAFNRKRFQYKLGRVRHFGAHSIFDISFACFTWKLCSLFFHLYNQQAYTQRELSHNHYSKFNRGYFGLDVRHRIQRIQDEGALVQTRMGYLQGVGLNHLPTEYQQVQIDPTWPKTLARGHFP